MTITNLEKKIQAADVIGNNYRSLSEIKEEKLNELKRESVIAKKKLNRSLLMAIFVVIFDIVYIFLVININDTKNPKLSIFTGAIMPIPISLTGMVYVSCSSLLKESRKLQKKTSSHY